MKLSNFFSNTKNFGIRFAFQSFIANHVHCINSEFTIAQKRDIIIKNYLKRKYACIIKNCNTNIIHTNNNIIKKPYTIWVCWWHGEENMPEIIQICYKSILKHANGNRVVLVTRENYKDYVTIPDYIINKVQKKIITLTHFSDILRICLLYEHGGLWLDATVLVTNPIENMEAGFFSLKCKDDLWENINKKRWLAFILYLSPQNILPEFTRKILFQYWKKYNVMIDYYLIDYIIDIGYDTNPHIKMLIDNIPPSNAIPHYLHNNPNEIFDPVVYNQICKETHFHKLNWKMDCRKYTANGELTYYGYILQLGET